MQVGHLEDDPGHVVDELADVDAGLREQNADRVDGGGPRRDRKRRETVAVDVDVVGVDEIADPGELQDLRCLKGKEAQLYINICSGHHRIHLNGRDRPSTLLGQHLLEPAGVHRGQSLLMSHDPAQLTMCKKFKRQADVSSTCCTVFR